MDTAGAVLLGSQTPTYEWVPEAWSSAGQDALDIAAESGLDMDPYQAHVLGGALGEERDDTWTVNEVGLIVGRQNGKGGIIEARELSGVFVFGERYILHSAHLQNTSNDAFLRMRTLIESNPDLDSRVTAISRSKGDEGFTFRIRHDDDSPPCGWCLRNGKTEHTARLRYMSRSGGASRGFTGVQLVILDEAMILDDGPIAAMLPTMATQSMAGQRWQVWYCGSAGDVRLRTESVVLARIRRRGYRREAGLAFYEFAAHLRHTKQCEPDCVVDVRNDPKTWAKVNPAMGRRISVAFLAKMCSGGMAAWDFDREFLGVGEYPTDEGWTIFGEDTWTGLQDPASKRGRVFAVGMESSLGLEVSSVSIASLRDDGMYHLEMIENRPGSAWLVDYAKALKAKKPCAFVVDPKGPARVVIPDLIAAKIKVFEPTLNDYSSSCLKLVQLVTETRTARHLNQPTMNTAAAAVKKHDVGQGSYVWERADTAADVTPWGSATMALCGLIRRGRRRGKPQVGSA